MTSQWFAPDTFIGIWSAVAATSAAIIAWRVFTWQRQSDIPVVLCEVGRLESGAEFLTVQLTVRNVTSTQWRAESLAIHRPSGAVGFSTHKAPRVVDKTYGDHSIDYVAAKLSASNPLPLGSMVNPVGTPKQSWGGGGDVSYETVYLVASSLAGKKLAMRLKLVSQDAIARRITVRISRSLPEPAQPQG